MDGYSRYHPGRFWEYVTSWRIFASVAIEYKWLPGDITIDLVGTDKDRHRADSSCIEDVNLGSCCFWKGSGLLLHTAGRKEYQQENNS